jgi:hypothetical protein
MNDLLCLTVNITLAENNETVNDLFRRHAVYDWGFLWIHGRQSENKFPMITFGFLVIKPRRKSPDLISLLSHTVPSTTEVLPWEELFYSLVPESYVLSYRPLCHSCIHLVTIFRSVRKTAKPTISFVVSVYPSAMEQLRSHWRILMKIKYFSKICQEYTSLIKTLKE